MERTISNAAAPREEEDYFGSGSSLSLLHEASMEDDIEVGENGMVSAAEFERVAGLTHEIKRGDIQLIDQEKHVLNLPSFFDMPEIKCLKFSVDEFLPFKERMDETVVSVNLDSELPANSLKILEEHREGLKQKVNLLKTLEGVSFKDLDVEKTRGSANLSSLSEEALDRLVTELIFNKTIREDMPTIQKLYKLKNIEELVNTSMNTDEARLNFNTFLGQIKEMLIQYEAIVKNEVSVQMSLLGGGSRKVDENIIDGLNEQIRSLEWQLKHEKSMCALIENSELFEDCKNFDEILAKIETFKAFSELLNWEVFSDCKNNFEIVEKINSFLTPSNTSLETFLEQLRLVEGFSDASIEEVIEKITKLSEQNKFYADLVSEYEKDKESYLNESNESSLQIQQLNEQLRVLEEENTNLKSNSSTSFKEEVFSHAAEEALDEIEEENEAIEEPRSKIGIGKKIAIGVGGVFALVFIYFLVISFIPVHEEQSATAKKEFNNAIKPTEITPKATPVQESVNEASSLENKIPMAMAAVVEPTPAGYDFNVVISEDALKIQKFDIYVDDSRKVRVNGKNFVAGETINGYKFIRTLNSGKILFMNEADGKSLWIMMNDGQK